MYVHVYVCQNINSGMDTCTSINTLFLRKYVNYLLHVPIVISPVSCASEHTTAPKAILKFLEQ